MTASSPNTNQIELHLLGGASVFYNGVPLTDLKSHKALALFAFLAYTGHTYTREMLGDLFWDAPSTAQSLSNLRTLLSRLDDPLVGALAISRRELGIKPNSGVRVDAVDLARAVNNLPQQLTEQEAERLGDVLQHYRGDFLSEFHIEATVRWQEWVILERERLRQYAAHGFERLVAFHLERGSCKQGIHLAQQWLALDPLNEAMHAQLMRLLVADGQRAAALAHFQACCRLFADEIGIEPGKELQDVFANIQNDTGRITLATHRAVPNNLPVHPTALIGREDEIALVRAQFVTHGARLVTILGEGGIGKTRLAQAVAQAIVDTAHAAGTPSFPDGVWWIPLNSLAAGSHATVENTLATAIAQAIGFSFPNARETPATQLSTYLQARSVLLVLDDFDELTDGAAYLAQLLQDAPGIYLLVTSRVPLNIQAEQRIPLSGLAAPSADGNGVLSAPSAQLFLAQLRRKDPHVRADAAMLAAIGELCRLVNGSPLALELAAHWGSHFDTAEIVESLRQADLTLLSANAADMPPRHRSMTAVFETSWRALSPHVQQLLAQLSVFRGPFSRRAARAISDARIADLVLLVDHSLLGQPSSGNYELHTLLRQFAAEKLATSTNNGLRRYTHYRHAIHYLHEIGANAHTVYQLQAPDVLQMLNPQLDNIRAAWRWAITEANYTELPALLSPAWAGLRNFFHVRNLFQEGYELFRWSAEQLIDRAEGEDALWSLAATFWAAAAFFLNLQHRYAPAAAAAQQARSCAEKSGNMAALALSAVEEGITLSNQRHNDAALARLNYATSLADHAKQPHAAARALHHSYRNYMDKGDIQQARAMLQEARTRYRQLNYQLAEGFILQSLGYVSLMQCRCLDAIAHLEQAHRTYAEAGDQPRAAAILPILGSAYEFSGAYERAQHKFTEAAQWVEQVHDPRYAAELAQRRGLLAWRLGDDEQAWAAARQAESHCRAIGYNGGLMWALNLLGLLHQRQGDFQTALQFHQEAFSLNRSHQTWLHWGGVLLCMGRAWCGLHRWQEAADNFQQAVDLFRRVDNQVWMIEAGVAQAHVVLVQGDREKAVALVKEVLPALERNPLHGAFEPATVYLTCHQILHTVDDDSARAILRWGVRRLQQQADSIQDATLRTQFLHQVLANRALLEAEHRASQARHGR